MASRIINTLDVFRLFLISDGPNVLSITGSENPIIAFNGVLNSWLIFAKKSVLTWLNFSAFSLASSNAPRVLLRSSISDRMEHTDFSPPQLIIKERRSSQNALPLVRTPFVSLSEEILPSLNRASWVSCSKSGCVNTLVNFKANISSGER